MESESVLIVATLFIFINAGFIACAELFRDPTSNNFQRDIISRIICPTCMAISIIAMIGAQRRNSFLLLPFLITLVSTFALLCGLAAYLIAWCPFFDDSGGDNFVCSIAIVLGAVCFAGSLLTSCLYYVVYSLYKFIRNGGIDEDDLNVTDIELLDRTHKDQMFDHEPYYDHDHDQPSTSYN